MYIVIIYLYTVENGYLCGRLRFCRFVRLPSTLRRSNCVQTQTVLVTYGFWQVIYLMLVGLLSPTPTGSPRIILGLPNPPLLLQHSGILCQWGAGEVGGEESHKCKILNSHSSSTPLLCPFWVGTEHGGVSVNYWSTSSFKNKKQRYSRQLINCC